MKNHVYSSKDEAFNTINSIPSVKILVSELKPGMVLARDIYDENFNLLLSEGMTITEKLIERIIERNIKEVNIDVTSIHLDDDVRSTFDRESYNKLKQTLQNSRDIRMTIGSLLEQSKEVVKKVINSDNFVYSLADYKSGIEEDLAAHSIRVCVYSLVVAKAYNAYLDEISYSKEKRIDYEDLAIAALLHDVGKACINDAVRKNMKWRFPEVNSADLKKDKVVQALKEYDEKYDPYYAYCLLADLTEISNISKAMVFFSRENETATGTFCLDYSKNVGGNITRLAPSLVAAEIINLCSNFDHDLSASIRRSETLENVQVRLSKAFVNKKFNHKLIELLLENIPLYPFGTKVQLGGDTNSYGIVIENFKTLADCYRPKVLVIPENKIIDLRDGTTTIVSQICGKEMRLNDLYINTTPLNDEGPRR